MVAALLLAVAVQVQVQSPADEPTLEQVRAAVDDYFADDEAARAASHAHLEQWGDAALPPLRELAGEPSGLSTLVPLNPFSLLDDLRLVCAIDEVGTPAAIDLLMDIADGKTGVAPDSGLERLEMSAYHKFEDELKDDAHFKALVLRSTLARGPMSGIQRSRAARTIGQLGWADAAEVLEPMALDDDRKVAEAAAAALFKLTGREVEVPRPALRFPGRLEDKAPLSPPREAPRSRRLPARFGFWRDGRAGLLIAGERSLSLIGPDGQGVATWETDGTVGALLSFTLPTGEGRWVVGTSASDYMNTLSAVVASDWEGATRWRFEPRKAADIGMAVLYDADGACGVALSPDRRENLVAFDDAGELKFSVWSTMGEALRSHPQLPGRLLVYGGDTQILDAAGRPTTMHKLGFSLKPRGEMVMTRHAALFPDRRGRPAVIAAGSAGFGLAPVIVRLDHDLAEIWKATVPGDISGLAMLEPDGGRRLFAAACETGELYVFDEHGTAYEPVRLVDPLKPGAHMWVRSMDAGPFDDGSWGLAVGLQERTLIYLLE